MELLERLDKIAEIQYCIQQAEDRIRLRNQVWQQFESLSDERKAKVVHDNDITRRAIDRLKRRLSKELFKAYLDATDTGDAYVDCHGVVSDVEYHYLRNL